MICLKAHLSQVLKYTCPRFILCAYVKWHCPGKVEIKLSTTIRDYREKGNKTRFVLRVMTEKIDWNSEEIDCESMAEDNVLGQLQKIKENFSRVEKVENGCC